MNDEQLNNILSAIDFKAIKQLALNEPDFSGRLKALSQVKIDRNTLGAIIEQTNTYSFEKSAQIDEAFKQGFDSSLALKKEWERFKNAIEDDEIYAGIKGNEERMLASFIFGYQSSQETNAILREINVRLADALVRAYGGTAMTADEMKVIAELARMAKEISIKLEGLDKLNKAGTEEK